MTTPVAVKRFVMLNPDGTNRAGNIMKADATVVMTKQAEQSAIARILGCKKVWWYDLKLQQKDGVYLATVYFDSEAADKRLPINDRIDVMIRDMHDKKLAPYPELPVCLFGPVVLVPVTVGEKGSMTA
ncbi:hypothetical protein D3C75_517540 [compost metagenome]